MGGGGEEACRARRWPPVRRPGGGAAGGACGDWAPAAGARLACLRWVCHGLGHGDGSVSLGACGSAQTVQLQWVPEAW